MIDIKTMTVPVRSRNPWFPTNSFIDKQVPFFHADPHENSAAGKNAAANTRGEDRVPGFTHPAALMGLYTHSLRKARDVNHCDFHYSHLLPKKPGILPLEETMTKKCRRCAAEFVTRSRIRKRCDACQTVVSAEKQKKANERLKARRAARRMCLVASG